MFLGIFALAMQACKRSFESISQHTDESSEPALHRVSLPWPLSVSGARIFWAIVDGDRSLASCMNEACELREWVRIGMNIDYVHPSCTLFTSADAVPVSTDGVAAWERYLECLGLASRTKDVCCVFVHALFTSADGRSSSEDAMHKAKKLGLEPDLAHILRFSLCLQSEFLSIPSEAIHTAVFTCFRTWGHLSLPFDLLAAEGASGTSGASSGLSPSLVSVMAELYGHAWLPQWLSERPHATCAGGAVVNAMMWVAGSVSGHPSAPSASSDIDIFVSSEGAWREAAASLSALLPSPTPVVTQGAVATWMCARGASVQLIFSRGESALDVVRLFDMDYVQVWLASDGAGHCTGKAAAAMMTGKAAASSGSLASLKPNRIVKAVDKGFCVDGVSSDRLQAMRDAPAYKASRHCHLRNLQLTDVEHAVALAGALYSHMRGAKAYATIADAFAAGFTPMRFGGKRAAEGTVGTWRAKRPVRHRIDFDYPTDGAEQADAGQEGGEEHAEAGQESGTAYAACASEYARFCVVPPEEAPASFADQDTPPFDAVREVTEMNFPEGRVFRIQNWLVPAVQVELGPLYCPFGFHKSNNLRLSVYGSHPNIGWFDMQHRMHADKTLKALQRLQQHCDTVLEQSEPTSGFVSPRSFLCEKFSHDLASVQHIDVRAVVNARTVLIDAASGSRMEMKDVPPGCVVEARVKLDRLYRYSRDLEQEFEGRLEIVYARVHIPPSALLYH